MIRDWCCAEWNVLFPVSYVVSSSRQPTCGSTPRNTRHDSAAGHPPLLRWNEGKLESIESNGLIFGVMSGCEYPVREISITAGDRFLLYTDGLIEPENLNGESFGDRRLGEVVCKGHSLSSPEVSDRLLSELQHWQPASAPQQDDITLIVIDVL